MSTTSLDLGQTPVGGSGMGTVTVTNTGTSDLILSGISSPASPFSLSASVQPVNVPTMNSIGLLVLTLLSLMAGLGAMRRCSI